MGLGSRVQLGGYLEGLTFRELKAVELVGLLVVRSLQHKGK